MIFVSEIKKLRIGSSYRTADGRIKDHIFTFDNGSYVTEDEQKAQALREFANKHPEFKVREIESEAQKAADEALKIKEETVKPAEPPVTVEEVPQKAADEGKKTSKKASSKKK